MFACRLLVILNLLFLVSEAVVDIYLSKDEVEKILGVKAKVYYVQDGVVEDYAMKFNVPLPHNVSDLRFLWRKKTPQPIHYKMTFAVSNDNLLQPPKASIPLDGDMPNDLQEFVVHLNCNRGGTGDVDVEIRLNYTYPSTTNQTMLVIRRKKFCLRKAAANLPKNNRNEENGEMNDEKKHQTAYIGITITPNSIFYIAVGCVCAFVVVISAVVLIYFVKTRREDRFHAGQPYCPQAQPFLRPETPSNASKLSAYTTGVAVSSSVFSGSSRIYSHVPSVILAEPRIVNVDQCLQHLSIERIRVRLDESIMKGTFGEVWHGSLMDLNMDPNIDEAPIMMKTLNGATPNQMRMFFEEGFMLVGLAVHPNIYQLLAAVSSADALPPILCYNRTAHGNLKKFLLRCSGAETGPCMSLSTQDLVYMAIQVVQGILHLHRYRIVHRDLATRNCVLDDNLSVKICDNSLARDLFPQDYHCIADGENRPIKWLAIESLLKREFSTASDIWQFGVMRL